MELDPAWYNLVAPTELIFLLNLLLALGFGFVMGIERESRSKDAGISTHMLVILGSMVFTYLSVRVDPASTSRIAAQIVTGIGFLGAGMILKDGDSVRNLTTAASIWLAASIGMAIGFGFYLAATLAAIAGTFIPRIPNINRLDHQSPDNQTTGT